jgi:hypothetical protein
MEDGGVVDGNLDGWIVTWSRGHMIMNPSDSTKSKGYNLECCSEHHPAIPSGLEDMLAQLILLITDN